MPKSSELLASYCSPNEIAFAEGHPNTRFAATIGELQKAIDLTNAKPGPGRPRARACGQLLNAAIQSKEDAYWEVQPAIEAMLVAA